MSPRTVGEVIQALLTDREKYPAERAEVRREILEGVCACYPRASYKWPCHNHNVCDADVTEVFDTLRQLKVWSTDLKTCLAAYRYAMLATIKDVREREKQRHHDYQI